MTLKEIREFIDEKQYPENRFFWDDVEGVYGDKIKLLPAKVKAKVHSLAYSQGHAGGYHDVLDAYEDLVELAHFTYLGTLDSLI